jgi:HNH endonuclease
MPREKTLAAVIELAPPRGKREKGSDDWRNGLPLCSTHHDAYDAQLFSIDPETLSIVAAPDISPADIGLGGGALAVKQGRPIARGRGARTSFRSCGCRLPSLPIFPCGSQYRGGIIQRLKIPGFMAEPLDCKSGGVWFAEAQMKSTAVQCTFTVYFLSILDPPLETAAALLLFASLAIPADGCGR